MKFSLFITTLLFVAALDCLFAFVYGGAVFLQEDETIGVMLMMASAVGVLGFGVLGILAWPLAMRDVDFDTSCATIGRALFVGAAATVLAGLMVPLELGANALVPLGAVVLTVFGMATIFRGLDWRAPVFA